MRIKMMASLVLAGVLVATATSAQQDTARPKNTSRDRVANGDVVVPKPPFRRLIQVYDPETQAGIEGVKVFDKNTGNTMVTSASGHIALVPGFVKQTGAFLIFEKDGYETVGPVLIDPQSDTTLLIQMSKAVKLAGMKIEAKPSLSNLEEHARITGAIVIPPGVMRSPKYEGKELMEVLRDYKLPVTDLKEQLNPTARIRPGRSSVACPIKVLKNGFSIGGDQIRYDDIAGAYDGVEFYAAHHQVPEEFSVPTNDCGTLIIWDRSR